MQEKLALKQAYTDWTAHQAEQFADHDTGMKQAIGGQFEAFGIIEREMLRFYGLPDDGYLIDIGCGSGRLALPLSVTREARYLGTDLVAFARNAATREDWRFEVVERLEIPEADNVADAMCFFSVMTHLLHEQSYLYLEEAKRVAKPGGFVLFSFLEFAMDFHWEVFRNTVNDARGQNQHPLNVFISRDAIAAWARHLDMELVDIRDGSEPFVPLPHPVTLEDGRVMEGFGNLGQSICVLRKCGG
ncbi:class I SAM-dependent methyltransferase [Chitinimonas sp.]|uniref:class I SAM-dependent methyltransferase n=1 Tax=Chitinimonas sp. TaxID=1934313 RepID=UPI0035B35319